MVNLGHLNRTFLKMNVMNFEREKLGILNIGKAYIHPPKTLRVIEGG